MSLATQLMNGVYVPIKMRMYSETILKKFANKVSSFLGPKI